MDSRNIVLTGFMGTGKTSTGRALAQLLDRAFVDMDTLIQDRAQMTVAEIFARHGEAYFRARESELCQELGAEKSLVIATGGGAFLNPHNRAAFNDAILICLDASPEEILRRLDGATDRPLLQGDKAARLRELMDARRAIYAAIPLHIQTDGRTPESVAREILNHLEPRTLRVKTPEGAYAILLGRELLEHIGKYITEFSFAARGAVVTNPTVGALYAERVMDSLRAHHFEPVRIEIPDGEQYKTLDTLRVLYEQFIAAKLERRSPILALGGGVLGDTVGFAAATYLRGVPLIQIPTTLLAMVDSSIGGKVAVDLPAGKNLVGAFKFPASVIADTSVLDTLPIAEQRAGMAEVIKHGIIGDATLFEELKTRALDEELLARALQVKIEIVERDPFEQNIRAHLNLGHTFGHAIESLSNYQMRHGYAVAIGIAIAARLAVNVGGCETNTRDAIIALLEKYELPTRVPREFSPGQILEAMGTDKKVKNKRLRLILPRAIGHVEIADNIPREEILRALEESQC